MRSMGIPLKMNGLIYKVTSLRSRQIYVLTLTIRMTHWMSPIVVLQKTSEQIYISPSHVIFWISAIYVQHTWNIILWKIKCIQLKQHHFEYMLICIHAYVYTYTCKKNIYTTWGRCLRGNRHAYSDLVSYWSFAVHWSRLPLVYIYVYIPKT